MEKESVFTKRHLYASLYFREQKFNTIFSDSPQTHLIFLVY